MAQGSRPPQFALMASAAVGGFAGALIAILIARFLMGPCCCPPESERQAASATETAVVETMAPRPD